MVVANVANVAVNNVVGTDQSSNAVLSSLGERIYPPKSDVRVQASQKAQREKRTEGSGSMPHEVKPNRPLAHSQSQERKHLEPNCDSRLLRRHRGPRDEDSEDSSGFRIPGRE